MAGRIVLSFLLFAFALRQGNFITPSRLSILDFLFIVLDGFSLWVHEAGHAYCMFFGKFIHFLGGTLAELVFPGIMIFAAHLGARPILSSLAVYTERSLNYRFSYSVTSSARSILRSGGGAKNTYTAHKK